jgi:hypothetical protein
LNETGLDQSFRTFTLHAEILIQLADNQPLRGYTRSDTFVYVYAQKYTDRV